MIELLHLLSKTKHAEVTGRAPKFVTCETCGHEYAYLIERKATADEIGFVFQDGHKLEEKALRQAEERLREKLAAECEPVPCPFCGWYQLHMFVQARRLRYGWMWHWSLIMLPVAVLLLVVSVIVSLSIAAAPAGNQAGALRMAETLLWVSFGASAAAALLLPPARLLCGYCYDPNRIDDQERVAIGKELAVPVSEVWLLLEQIEPDEG